ncbi:DUF1330 domain-containing protein [uncultured Erythrobacter sp.]|uniref:DUF1330 domain-containing protein n=1 Tax=uncultured Erythrobacter sp. TaxID=263913 RepID=UPI00260F9DB3|nr:DUF1330 domain-containing protein [uncultured Erythrobacter sp.]
MPHPEFFSPKRSITLAAITALMLAPTGLAHASASGPSDAEEAPAHRSFSVELKRGEVLQLIAPEARADAADARAEYYRTAVPPAEELGFRRLGQLNVRQKVVSEYDPGGFIFFSWPSQAAFDQFSVRPDLPEIEAMRPQGWDELRLYNLELEEDISLQFRSDKHYTVVVAWLDAENSADYDRYLDGIEPAVRAAGGRFVYKMRAPSMEAHNSPPGAPGQITFVEWSDVDGFAKVQQSQEYLDHRQYFGSSVDRFEFYWLEMPA